VTADDEGIINPIDYPNTLSLEQYKAAQQAGDLIEPVERNQTPRIHGIHLWRGMLSHSVRDACRIDVEAALWDIGYALFIENFYAYGRTSATATRFFSAFGRVIFFDGASAILAKTFFHFVSSSKGKPTKGKLGMLKPRTKSSTRRSALAIWRAFLLSALRKYGSERVTATKGGKFRRLAALLYGDLQGDLINQCKAYIRAPTSTAVEYTEQARVQRVAEGEKSGAK